jgi:hypothetical protein
MKQILGVAGAIAFIMFLSCNDSGLPPVVVENEYVNPFAGTYRGLFFEAYSGVDSNGVFKNEDSFQYDMIIGDAGNREIMIQKGPFVFDNLPVDTFGFFTTDSPYVSLDSLGYSVNGHFVNDSLYIEYKAINGGYNYPQWFTIVQFTFRGRRIF